MRLKTQTFFELIQIHQTRLARRTYAWCSHWSHFSLGRGLKATKPYKVAVLVIYCSKEQIMLAAPGEQTGKEEIANTRTLPSSQRIQLVTVACI